MTSLPRVYITDTDLQRLRETVERGLFSPHAASAELLEQELDRAEVISAASMPPDVVTMRSRVRFEDLSTGRTRELSLVYPPEADLEAGKLSVLTPVGTALLGLRVGDAIDWPMPRGRSSRLRVQAVSAPAELPGE